MGPVNSGFPQQQLISYLSEKKPVKVTFTDLYRLSKIPDNQKKSRAGLVILLTMLSITLSVSMVILCIAHPTKSHTFNIVGEVDDYEDVSNDTDIIEDSPKDIIEEIEEEFQTEKLNNRPIIGVLSQELDEELMRKLPKGHNFTAYIAASYVKWVESGGARAVPILIGQSEQYYRKLFDGLNGLLLPGGSAPLTGPGGFAEVAELFFKWAKEANDEGDYFPIWGTCNGFEMLTVLSVKDDQSRLTDCYSEDQALPLHLRGDWRQSRIFGMAPRNILRDITKRRVTINFHHFCLTPANFTKFGMDHFWNALSVNRDYYDLEYISTIEAKNYPFFGVQFHPEKNIFEWSPKEENIPHSAAAVNVANYFSRFLVNLARQSKHKFSDDGEEYSIYNFDPLYTGGKRIDMTFEQAYVF